MRKTTSAHTAEAMQLENAAKVCHGTPDVLDMGMVCPDSCVKHPNLDLGAIEALLPQLVSLKARSHAVGCQQHSPLGVFRQFNIAPLIQCISCGIALQAIHPEAGCEPAHHPGMQKLKESCQPNAQPAIGCTSTTSSFA